MYVSTDEKLSFNMNSLPYFNFIFDKGYTRKKSTWNPSEDEIRKT